MNAVQPLIAPDVPPATSPWRDAPLAVRLVGRLSLLYLGLALAVLTLLWLPFGSIPAELRRGGLGGFAAASVLVALAALLATVPLARARARIDLMHTAPAVSPQWRRRWLRQSWIEPRQAVPSDPALRLGRLARRPQGVIVPALAACAIGLAWALRPGSPAVSPDATLIGAVAICAGFPLLIAERIMAAVTRRTLPEASGLQALLFLPTLLIPLAGVIEIAAGLGVPLMPNAMAVLDIFVGLVAAELAVRALANWFLPPPPAVEARAAVTSVAALLLQPGRLAPDGFAAPIRTHLGLDFSRSWALRFARTAALPIGLLLAVIAWGLTGVSLIELDQRGIYERLGAPVAVWAPGVHVGLPWPLGRVRRVDLGVIHAVLLGDAGMAELRSPAEAPPPESADRLWDRVHPSEVSYLVASRESDGRQGFQAVSLDLKVLYRVGLDDASALHAAYAVDSADALVRAEAGQLMARVFAGQVLAGVLGEGVLGEGRETMAASLRTQLQTELDRFGSGIELAAIVIEAVHPPPGAAAAYHDVQAAEIIANTAIATERGRALATASRARQSATDLTLGAQSTAADTVGQAAVAARSFTADQDAFHAGGSAFLLERYLFNVRALARSPLVIIDHHLAGPDAPAIDLRSFGAPAARPGDDD